MKKLNQNKVNRRLAFRIYEEVNLFYHKIDQQTMTEPNFEFDKVLNNTFLLHMADNPTQTQTQTQTQTSSVSNAFLPDSICQENDTLNVNISVSGIAFTCKDQLKAGDYLMIRMLLLSSKTLIMTCCKVVYCKPSNPYENNRYPFLIGAQFVNMTDQDSELIKKYVNKHRKLQFVLNGGLISFVIFILLMPEEALELLLDLLDKLHGVLLDIIYITLSYISFGVDFIIEYLFQTSPHVTQIAEFYIMLVLQIGISLLVLRSALSFSKTLDYKVRAYFSRKKASIFYYWGEQSLLYKAGIISLVFAAITCYGLFAV